MKGDFTRTTFRPEKHYSSVRLQQGRMQLDSDWNEQLDIQAHFDQTARRDLIGGCATPGFEPGFALLQNSRLDPGRVHIGRGRYYVDGILCENDSDIPLDAQPDFPEFRLPSEPGVYLAYLDVWQHHLTALEDPDIREVALGGPDTSTRTKTVWQVKLFRVGDPGAQVDCAAEFEGFKEITLGTTGRLSARAERQADGSGPCIVAPGAGYRRLENQLYRVEIHAGGEPGRATFKWSRDNGALAFAIDAVVGEKQVQVKTLGLDPVLGLRKGDWVEVLDDSIELGQQAGVLAQVLDLDPAQRLVTLSRSVSGGEAGPGRHPKLRRWESVDETPVEIPAAAGGWIALEDGVEIRFEAGSYRTGDYWLIPARTATGGVDWPQETRPGEAPQPLPQPPHGLEHHYCHLGLLTIGAAGEVQVVADCRRRFPALTDLAGLYYVGGDGQSAAPGAALPRPLEAGVAHGPLPVAGATVKFAIVGGAGDKLRNPATQEEGLELLVTTGPDGVASCLWTLDSREEIGVQRVDATLVSVPGMQLPPKQSFHLPLHFTAQARVVQAAVEPALHITGLFAKNAALNNVPLNNDTDLSIDTLGRGLQVVCDGAPTPAMVGRPTCYVTVEVPFPLTPTDRSFWGSLAAPAGYQPVTVEAAATVSSNTITWLPAQASVLAWLDKLFLTLPGLNFPGRVLARLTLKGNFIRSTGSAGLHLDGDSFGSPQAGGQVVTTQLTLPSGDGRRGGDFEMWFWLVAPELKSVAVAPGQGSVGADVTGTLTLNRPAPAGGLTVSLSSSSTLLQFNPASVVIPANETSKTFKAIVGASQTNQTVTITATLGGINRTTQFIVVNNL